MDKQDEAKNSKPSHMDDKADNVDLDDNSQLNNEPDSPSQPSGEDGVQRDDENDRNEEEEHKPLQNERDDVWRDDVTLDNDSQLVSPSQPLGEGQRDENEDMENISQELDFPLTWNELLLGAPSGRLRQRRGEKLATNSSDGWIMTPFLESSSHGEERFGSSDDGVHVNIHSRRLDDGALRDVAINIIGTEEERKVTPVVPPNERQARTPEEPNRNASYRQGPGDGGGPVLPAASTPEERERQRFWYLIWRVCLSLFGHAILLVLSFKLGFGEETCGHHEEAFRKWLRWGLMKLIFPSVVFIPMVIIVKKFDLDDVSPDEVGLCKIVNLATITWSKVVYFAIREAPGGNVKVRVITAHAVAVVIDTLGAVYLNRKNGCLDQDIGG